MNYESCRKVEALKSIMAHFKTKEKTCHKSFTTTIGNANFTTHLYIDIFLWPKFVINTLIFENTFIKHYINIVSSGYLFEEQKGINCSPQVCLHNHHPEAKNILPSPLSAVGKVKPTTRNKTTPQPPRRKNHQLHSVWPSCPNSSMLNSNRASMNAPHHNYLLLQ